MLLGTDPDLRLGRWQDVLRDVPGESARLILTSPNYDNAREYEGTNEPVDFDELAQFGLRVLVPGGVFAMVLDGAVNDGVLLATAYRVICDWAAMKGWRLLEVLAYGRQGAAGEYKGRFRRDHEPLLVMVKDGAQHVCAKDRLAERAAHAAPRAMTSRERSGRMRPKTSHRPDAFERRHRGSIWWYGSIGNGHDPSSGTGHPATFAERFARDAVTVWSNPGDLVVDPFAGAATSGRAAMDLGRRWIGAERVEKYHAIGMRRLAQRCILPLDAEG